MWLASVRDVAIVLLALETLVIGALLAITLLQIRSLVRVLRDEVLPMLQSANDTVTTVKGTTRFVSDTVVSPIIKVTSVSTGTLQALRSLALIVRRVARRDGTGMPPAGGSQPREEEG